VSPRPAARRARIDRWIISLNPMFEVIAKKVQSLKLGEPRLQCGPTFMDNASPSPEKIRRGAVWFVGETQTGFHVDFMRTGVHIEAWSGKDRRVSVWVAGAYTESTLKKDLTLALAASGLTELARTSEVRNILNGQA
jgi:hypothetical protein